MLPFAWHRLQFIVLLYCAWAYYYRAEMEGYSGLWWSAISAAV